MEIIRLVLKGQIDQ